MPTQAAIEVGLFLSCPAEARIGNHMNPPSVAPPVAAHALEKILLTISPEQPVYLSISGGYYKAIQILKDPWIVILVTKLRQADLFPVFLPFKSGYSQWLKKILLCKLIYFPSYCFFNALVRFVLYPSLRSNLMLQLLEVK